MRHTLLIAVALAAPALSSAEVVELDGEELVDAYVQGISIGQVVRDKAFSSDDQQQRETAVDRQNAQGPAEAEIAVANAAALEGQPPRLNELVPETLAGIQDPEVRDLAEDALVSTSIIRQDPLASRVEFNYDKLAELGITAPNPAGRDTDLGALQGAILELLPSTTGYQFEFMNNR